MRQIMVNGKQLTYYPKQKLVRINKQGNGINYEKTKSAMRVLSPAAVEMYLYFCMIENQSIWVLSRQYIYDNTLLTKKTYTKAINELIEHKFLVPGGLVTDNKEAIRTNVYDFFEEPKM